MNSLPIPEGDPGPHTGTAHYKGDIRESDYIVGRRTDGRIMRAMAVSYDEEANMTTVDFEETLDPQWYAALDIEEQAQQQMHLMYPAFYPTPAR